MRHTRLGLDLLSVLGHQFHSNTYILILYILQDVYATILITHLLYPTIMPVMKATSCNQYLYNYLEYVTRMEPRQFNLYQKVKGGGKIYITIRINNRRAHHSQLSMLPCMDRSCIKPYVRSSPVNMIQSSGYLTLKHYPIVMSQIIGQDIYKKYSKEEIKC